MTTTTTPVHVAVLLDASRSMQCHATYTINGFNEYLSELNAAEAAHRVTLASFGSAEGLRVRIEATDLDELPQLDFENQIPQGSTELFGAIENSNSRYTQEQIAVVRGAKQDCG